MNYWEGFMNWPVKDGWLCETCGEYSGLEWGLRHAECRCNTCHTQYYMRDLNDDQIILTTPHCELKDEYKEPAKKAWNKYHIPVDELSDEQWDEFTNEDE